MASTIARMEDENPALGAVTGSLICERLDEGNPSLVLVFAVACALWSIAVFVFLQPEWVLGLVPGLWSVVGTRRWLLSRRRLN